MNIHLPAILMWTEGAQGFDTLPPDWSAALNIPRSVLMIIPSLTDGGFEWFW